MIATQNNITIDLENEDEIRHFWNIVMFAIEHHKEKAEKGEPLMTDDELKMAKKLVDVTEKKW